MLPELMVMLPLLLWLAVTVMLPPARVMPPQVPVPARTTEPALADKVPVLVFVPVKVCVPVPTLVRLRAYVVLASVKVPAKVASALLPPTFRLPARAFVVTVPRPVRLPMSSEPADIASVEPVLMVTTAASGMPLTRPTVATPTWTLPVPARVTLPEKVLTPTEARIARPVPMNVTLPVPLMPPKSVRSAALASNWTSRARTMLLKPNTPVPARLSAEPMVAVPVPLAETTILLAR